jgi:hypothetical protein
MDATPATDFGKITKVYLKIRDARAALSKDFDEKDKQLKAQLTTLENAMLAHLNATGSESVRTENATFFSQEEMTVSCQDWAALYKWIADNDAWDVLERRVKKTFVKEFAEAHDGSLPPGVSAFREKQVRVRRAS